MNRILLFISVLLLCNIPLTGQTFDANTLVLGKINNRVSLEKEITIQLNVRYMTSDTEEYTSNILEDGTFAFGINVREPQYATLIYSREKKLIYLEPYDTLGININGGTYPYNVLFGERGGGNNTFLAEYLKENPKELNQFKKVQFRKEIFWYSTLPQQDKDMRNTTPESFAGKLQQKKDRAFAKLDFYRKNNQQGLTPDFVNFMETEFMYEWAYNKLMFGHLYKGRYDLQESYFSFLDEIPLVGGSIGNHLYRDYVLAVVNYRYEKGGDLTAPYVKQYDFATNNLIGNTQAFVQSEMLYKAFLDKELDSVLGRYWAFIDNTEHLDYEAKVNYAYQKATRYAEGSPAPDFTLPDINENTIQLAQYGGKVVYLNFWASWCRPCMKKMTNLKPFIKEMENQGIVILNVSLDRNAEDWQKTVKKMEFGGVHVMADGDIDSDIAQKYEVRILPQYYIVNKNGSFAQRPPKNDLTSIRTTLTELSR